MVTKFNFQELDFKGAFKIQPFYATDERGGFIKDYSVDLFRMNGIEHELKEVFLYYFKERCNSCYSLSACETASKVGSLH